MSSARFGLLIATALATSALASPAAQAAPQTAPPPSGSSFTPVPPTRVYDTRTSGHQIPARVGYTVSFPTSLVPADATAVVFNLTGTNAAGPTFLAVGEAGSYPSDTSNLNLAAGETRANLVTSVLGSDSGGNRAVEVAAGGSAVDAIIDVAGYYAPTTGSKFTSLPPQRVLDTRDSAPVGPGGSVTLDLSSKVPAGATSAVFNLTGTDVTGSTFVTAYPAGQAKPDASNLNLEAGQTSPNLVTVQLSADRKVTLANAHSSVDLIADLAGYYSPDSTQSFFPLHQLRTLDTRDRNGNPREPLGPGATHTVDLGIWLPDNATAAVYNLTATNVTGATYLTAWPSGATRPSASNLNLAPGQTAANASITALSADRKLDVFNHVGQTDVITDLAGYFAPSTPACTAGCVHTWGMNNYAQFGDGTTDGPLSPRTPGVAYGVSNVVAAENGTVLRSDGTVWAWGVNAAGELTTGRPGGTGDTPDGYSIGYSTNPAQVLGLHDITQFAHGVAVRSDHTVWTWGDNGLYELGNGSTDRGLIPSAAVQVSGLTDVVAVASDYDVRYALKSDGTVWSWGANYAGQLGSGLVPNPNDCGDSNGVSPVGLNCASAVPVQVAGLDHVTKLGLRLAIKSDGTVWQFAGMDNAGHALAPQQVPGATGAVTLAGQGDGTAYALMPDGTVLAWGAGGAGQLGNGGDCGIGNCPSSATPVQVSGLTGVTALADNHDTGYALKSDGTVWAWGDASSGALGDGAWIGHNSSVPVQIAGLSGVTAIGNGVAVTNVP